jgi:predicted amidophosphoribosyltransferase
VASPTCPNCGSAFLQPLRCETRGEDLVLVELRCADCMTWLSEPYTRSEVRELDSRQGEWRQALLDAYERSVTESMDALATLFGAALALDLIDADDFAPRRFARTA